MTKSEIASALSRPPVFGDVEQIKAIHAIQRIEEEREGKTEYHVTVKYSFKEDVTVWAENEFEAKNIAREEVDYDEGDFIYSVERVKP